MQFLSSSAIASDVSAIIRGTTQLYPVIGYPVTQVKAPMLYNALFTRHQIDAAVVPMEIAPDVYEQVLPALFKVGNVAGAMVTIPHKTATVALLDDCSLAVRIAGACNAVVRRPDGTLYGDLFDGIGFVHAVQRHDFSVNGAHCLVVGTGGAGAAIAAALADAGACRIRLFDARQAQAKAVASHLQGFYPHTVIEVDQPRLAGFDLVVNATPLGMNPDDPLPIDVAQIEPQMVIAEIVMKREITPMLAAAQSRGCRIVLGREMLQEQLALYLDFFGLTASMAI